MTRKITNSDQAVQPQEETGVAESSSPLADLMAETALYVSRLAQERDIDVGTVSRWIMTGVKGRAVNGVRPVIKLESYRLGGRVFTTREAFARFAARLNGELPTLTTSTVPATRTAAERKRASEAASRLARSLGA